MGYLLDYVPSTVDRHWCNILNKHPKLETIDIDVKHDSVKTSLDKLLDLKTLIKDLHIYSDEKKEETCAKAMISMYKKIHNPFTMNKTLSQRKILSFCPRK